MNHVNTFVGVVCRHKNTDTNDVEKLPHVVDVRYNGSNISIKTNVTDSYKHIDNYLFAWADSEESETEWLNAEMWFFMLRNGLKKPKEARLSVYGGIVYIRATENWKHFLITQNGEWRFANEKLGFIV